MQFTLVRHDLPCSLKKRVTEHAEFNNKRNSGIAEHCIGNSHSLDIDNIQLHEQNKEKRLDLKISQKYLRYSVSNILYSG